MSAIPEPTLRFPSSLSHRERELWEREAAHLGYFTESAQEVMERHPIEEGEGQILYRKRIETIRRAEAAIEDGRKEEPSQNARTHGFTAKTFRLAPGEREEDYQVRISDSLRRYQPRDSEEMDQIVIIVNATWQLLRIQCAASDLMCLNYEQGTTASDALLLHNGTDFNSLARYEGTQNRTLDKARKRLKELKQERSGIGILPMRPMGIPPMEEDSERGVGVSPAKEESTSPRPEEPQTKITKRAPEMIEDSPSPFPGRERDGSNDHASHETTRTPQPNHEVVASPSQGFEAQRRTLVEEAAANPTVERLSRKKAAKKKITKRTLDGQSGAGAPPAKEEPHEPKSPRAHEPQQRITKRNLEKGSTKVNPASRLEPALPSAPGEPHANNQQLTRQQPEQPSHLDRLEMQELRRRALTFLAAQSWCRSVGEVRLAWGSPELALCLAYASSRDEGRWIWVVVGDVPPAHLDTGPCPNAEEALREYVGELRAWLKAAKEGEPSKESMPMLHPSKFVRLTATPEAMSFIENRACFVEGQVLQTRGEELRAIGIRPDPKAREAKRQLRAGSP